MTADLFVAAFLGCLLALAVAGIAVWQISTFVVRRKVKNLTELLLDSAEAGADGDAELRGQLDAFARRRMHKVGERDGARPPGAAPIGPLTLTCGGCPARAVGEDAIGWGVRSDGVIHCPACIAKAKEAAV